MLLIKDAREQVQYSMITHLLRTYIRYVSICNKTVVPRRRVTRNEISLNPAV